MTRLPRYNELSISSIRFTLLVGVIVLSFFVFVGLFVNSQPANAAPSKSGFKAGNIMSDSVMSNKNSMNEAQIQAFLKSKNTCNNRNLSILSSRTATRGVLHSNGKTYRYYLKNGHFVCMADQKFGGESAAHIIYRAAQDYNVNPQVLIVLLQKEQRLVTDDWPNTNYQYKTATGYGCPDSGPNHSANCNSNYYGFKNQVRHAAKLFHTVLYGGWSNYPVGNNNIKYNPSPSCGSSTVNIKNRATSALYRYTPYQPNAATLATNWGATAPCGAYGNLNFYMYFTSWFGDTSSPSHTDFITCNGQKYLIENGTSRKRLLTNKAITTWGLADKDFDSTGYGCNYGTFDLPLSNLVRSRATDNLYLVDEGKAYRVNSQATADAWGLGDISDHSAYPNLDSKSITENISTTVPLPRLAKSPNTGKTYLADNGKRHMIKGSNTSDTSSLQLVRGYNEVPSSVLSVPLIQTLTSSGDIDYSFKVGSNWYLLNHNEVLRADSNSGVDWDSFLTGPSLTNSALGIFDKTSTLGDYFERDGYYYRFDNGNKLERTKNSKIMNIWHSGSYPTITRLLTNKLTNQLGAKDINKMAGDSTRLISCNGDKYLVERFIRIKRKLTPTAITNWQFANAYFSQNDHGCAYPTYNAILEKVIRSRDTGKEYMVKDSTAYLLDRQASANAWNLGDYKNNVYPQFNGSSIHDNLTVKYSLPSRP